ncbi:MAG: prepilin peptidase [Bacillota bacterium]
MLFFIFLLGCLIGSFLNVCICRLPQEENISWALSRCPRCGTRLQPGDLVPVVSYLLLKGKCRICQGKISPRYPLVELLTGGLFLLTFFQLGFSPHLVKHLFLFACLLVVSFVDLEHQIIPDKLVVTIFLWGGIWQLFSPQISYLQSLAGAFLGGGFLFLVARLSKGGMGGGDIKLMLAAGFYLGGSLTILALFLAFLTGSVVGIILLVFQIKGRKEPIPFGPFLAQGIFASVLWGEEILNFYFQTWLF